MRLQICRVRRMRDIPTSVSSDFTSFKTASATSGEPVMTGIEPDKPVVISSDESIAGTDVDAPGKQNHRDGF